MCHADLKLSEDVKKGSKDGFWPEAGEGLVGGSYVLVHEDAVITTNFCDTEAEVEKVRPVLLVQFCFYLSVSAFCWHGRIRKSTLGSSPMVVNPLRYFASFRVGSKPFAGFGLMMGDDGWREGRNRLFLRLIPIVQEEQLYAGLNNSRVTKINVLGATCVATSRPFPISPSLMDYFRFVCHLIVHQFIEAIPHLTLALTNTPFLIVFG